MTKRKTVKPATPIPLAPEPHRGPALEPHRGPAPETLYDQALSELQITVPVACCRVLGSRLEFRLYGGRVLYWPPAADDEPTEEE